MKKTPPPLAKNEKPDWAEDVLEARLRDFKTLVEDVNANEHDTALVVYTEEHSSGTSAIAMPSLHVVRESAREKAHLFTEGLAEIVTEREKYTSRSAMVIQMAGIPNLAIILVALATYLCIMPSIGPLWALIPAAAMGGGTYILRRNFRYELQGLRQAWQPYSFKSLTTLPDQVGPPAPMVSGNGPLTGYLPFITPELRDELFALIDQEQIDKANLTLKEALEAADKAIYETNPDHQPPHTTKGGSL